MINRELYVPKQVTIDALRKESDTVVSYRVRFEEDFMPGQFLQVSVLGEGEVPISISSSPTKKRSIELTVRNSGKVTKAMHALRKGDTVGLRGPYGNHFPIEDMARKNLLFVAGGIGLAALRSLICYVLENRREFGKLRLYYGARAAGEMIYRRDLEKWRKAKDIDVLLTVDTAEPGWRGNVGVVTGLLKKKTLKDAPYTAIICGPAVMIKYTIQKLLHLGFRDEDIIVSLERHMKCGVGKCGHCYLADKYVCVDGPVFSYLKLKNMQAGDALLF